VTGQGLTLAGLERRYDLSTSEGRGIPGGAVKCVEIWKNTEGEGSVLGSD
jgi:hypothetical protein